MIAIRGFCKALQMKMFWSMAHEIANVKSRCLIKSMGCVVYYRHSCSYGQMRAGGSFIGDVLGAIGSLTPHKFSREQEQKTDGTAMMAPPQTSWSRGECQHTI